MTKENQYCSILSCVDIMLNLSIPQTYSYPKGLHWVVLGNRLTSNLRGDNESDSDSDVNLIDREEDRAEEEATKQRKRAGLPEIDVDAKPSTSANKMMNLAFNAAVPPKDLLALFLLIVFYLACACTRAHFAELI